MMTQQNDITRPENRRVNRCPVEQGGKMKRFFAQIWALKPFIAIGVVICLLIWALTRPAPKPSDAPQVQPTAAEIAHNKESEEHDEAQEHVKSFILKSLKAPSTAKFPGYSEIPVVKKDGYWESYTYVDAQNSYGAMIRTNYYVKMENQGDRWRLVKIDSGF